MAEEKYAGNIGLLANYSAGNVLEVDLRISVAAAAVAAASGRTAFYVLTEGNKRVCVCVCVDYCYWTYYVVTGSLGIMTIIWL